MEVTVCSVLNFMNERVTPVWNDETFLRVCCDCNSPFFTYGEEQFYKEKGLSFPIRCKSCRDALKLRRRSALIDIKENWKRDAKTDDEKYFYTTADANEVFAGRKHFVIGRKGSGKTAMCGYLLNYSGDRIFSEKMSFKNFPFNELYNHDNSKYTAPNRYITIWKYLIYTCVCRMMIKNQAIDSIIRSKLEKIYGVEPIRNLERAVGKWTTNSFSVEVLGVGGSISGEKNDNISWIDAANALEDIIMEHLDDAKYFIVLDELDEDYRDFSEDGQKDLYVSLLTSLFKAVQDIKSIFSDIKPGLCPVVFLRNDIYGWIKDSDKSKWGDFCINVEWDRKSLQNMLTNRIRVACEIEEPMKFDIAWKKIFDQSVANSFSSITKSTHLRPRDYVEYIRACATSALEENHNYVMADDLRWADKEFSNYLKGEIIDEIYPVLPDIETIFAIISQIRKDKFRQDEFRDAYELYVKRGLLINGKGYEYVLTELFNFSVIGNYSNVKDKAFFKYENKEARFNYKEDLIVHWGLNKALQLI